ncbi:MAG TPA: hypothetical protein VGE51_12800 [Fontimonas sp.]
MKRWDLVVGASGAVAVLAFGLLVAVMVNPKMADFSMPAVAVLAGGVLGVIAGMIGMSKEVSAEHALSGDDEAFAMNGRLDVYRQLQRGRSRRTAE